MTHVTGEAHLQHRSQGVLHFEQAGRAGGAGRRGGQAGQAGGPNARNEREELARGTGEANARNGREQREREVRGEREGWAGVACAGGGLGFGETPGLGLGLRSDRVLADLCGTQHAIEQ